MMPNRRITNAVRLEFESAGSHVHANLSGAACTGEWLWVAGDEACEVNRLRRLEPLGRETLRYGDATLFPSCRVLDLPGASDDEADLEGMAAGDGYLWVVGSHGLKRKKRSGDASMPRTPSGSRRRRWTRNRRLLACLPIENDAEGTPYLVREARDGRRARRLKGDAKANALTQLLDSDEHFGPYMTIPGKDNGFDIEGLAVDGERLLLGLRGPVLRGWSAVLEIAVEPHGDELRLKPLDDDGTLLRKHFLNLDGRGVRDLHFSGDDLHLLAGPTMVLDGDIGVYRWPGAQGRDRRQSRAGALRAHVRRAGGAAAQPRRRSRRGDL